MLTALLSYAIQPGYGAVGYALFVLVYAGLEVGVNDDHFLSNITCNEQELKILFRLAVSPTFWNLLRSIWVVKST